jgi:hypothetical protein
LFPVILIVPDIADLVRLGVVSPLNQVLGTFEQAQLGHPKLQHETHFRVVEAFQPAVFQDVFDLDRFRPQRPANQL